MQETTTISVDGEFAQLGAMAFFAVLAYPESIAKRDEFIKACKAWLTKRAIVKGYPRSDFPDDIRRYPTRAIYESGPITKAVSRIRGRRLPAAEMAEAILFSKINGEFKLTNRLNQFRTESVCHGQKYRRVKDIRSAVNSFAWRTVSKYGDPKSARMNVRARVWNESEPVLHFALALRFMINSGALREYYTADIVDLFKLLIRPAWLPDAVETAEMVRVHLLPLIGISEKLNGIRLITQECKN